MSTDLNMSTEAKTSTEDTLPSKQYIERGVQTDSLVPIVTPPSLALSKHSTSGLQSASDSVTAAHSPSPSHSRSSTQFDIDSAYSLTPDVSVSSPTHSFSTTARTYKRRNIPFNRPSTKSLAHKAVSHRLVSLPETASAFSAKAALEKKTMRIVSMPLPSQDDSTLLSDDFDLSAHSGEPFISEDEEGSRVRVLSHATDIPHTPSPPSSPESVLIIANKNSLSEGFLRHNIRIQDTSTPRPDDEGWITWAKSPPRPIPALHGPLSLPYARCPSGAEGTIIEEQDNLPRMIWGLEGEDHSSSRPRPEATPGTQSIPHQVTSQHSVPPRFQNANLRAEAEAALRSQKPKVQEPKRTYASTFQRKDQAPTLLPQPQSLPLPPQQEHVGYPLRGQEPIDLSTIVPQPPDSAGNGNHSEYDFYGTRAPPLVGHGLRVQDLGCELGIDWHTALHAQEKLRNSGYLSSVSHALSNVLRDKHKPPSVTGSPSLSLEYLASSRSPIILEPPGQVKSHSTAPRRMSALEIAQQYRQQQLQQQHQQQQSLLPTPPNSTSPIWSSNFSPYQGSMISPELLSVPRLSKLSPTGLQSNSAFLRSDTTQQLRAAVQERSHTVGLIGRRNDLTLLAPPARIEEDLLRARSLLPIGSNTLVNNSVASYLQAQSRKARNAIPASQVDRSPAVPRPPPNTPLSALSSPSTTVRNKQYQTSVPTPPSPTSPKPRLRSITQQHARSIPLARLIQRRLSSVPEEEVGANADLRSSPSPPPSYNPRARRYSSGESPVPPNILFLLSPPSPMHVGARSSSPFQPALVSQSTGNGCDAGFLSADVLMRPGHATVKLPGVARAEQGRGVDLGSQQDATKAAPARGQETVRGRGSRRGRGKKGRGGSATNVHFSGTERVDGGLMVKS